MVTVKKNDIKHFSDKLKRIVAEDTLKRILETLCDYGTRYARLSYGGVDSSITVDYEISADGVGIITAQGEQIAYIEYGTGEKGRGAYEGKLPDQLISFHSNAYDVDVTLQGWTYSYAKELGITDKPWSGTEPKANMWKTAKYLRDVFANITKGWLNYENVR